MSENQIIIKNLSKVYKNGFNALKSINLNIKKGEIFAMLGPNGAGKTTLISVICGIVKPSSGKVTVDNFDIIDDYRETRSRIGLVPQELTLEQFETVFNNVSYSRGLYGKKPDPQHIEKILKQLSLWDKKDQRLRQLSGGMKRRVLIAKALSHEPSILFLDEPTAGVDVELRQDMWKIVEEQNLFTDSFNPNRVLYGQVSIKPHDISPVELSNFVEKLNHRLNETALKKRPGSIEKYKLFRGKTAHSDRKYLPVNFKE